MTTLRVCWKLYSAAAIIAASLLPVAWAKEELPASVRRVLSEERQLGPSNWNRRQRLGEVLVSAKGSDEVLHWQAGFVKVNGRWLPAEEAVTPAPMTGTIREYLDRRERAEPTWPSQTALASWCSQHGLPEQALAHNYHALQFAPRDADLSAHYQRMGYVRVGTHWLSRQEAFEAQRDLVEYFQHLESQAPVVSRFADDLEANRVAEPTRRDRIKQLAANNKISALELVLAPRSERCGQAAVDALRQIPTYQAAQALGRIAVSSPWLFVRDSAIEGLKDRRLEHFVPQWLAMLRTPVTTEFQRVTWGRHQGVLCIFSSEREFETQVAQLFVWPNMVGRRPANGPQDRLQLMQFYDTALRGFREKTRLLVERPKLIVNGAIEQQTELVIESLRLTTGEDFGVSPRAWWDWWHEFSGYSAIPKSAKPVVVVVKEDVQVNLPPPPRPIESCLVAGTPIWTERGLVAVERIQPGDRVLSKNVETGELAYKVVLHTTVREPVSTRKFVIGDESIQATEGHHFWVSGRGWTKTRELAAEQRLHTPTGAVRVASLAPAESVPTYNLVVADFHTYFVGKTGLLSHDVLPPKPTDKQVPGLDD